MNNFITFSINDQFMGLEMLSVERIIKLFKVSPVPNSSKCVEGVIDVQNELIPVINLKKKFNYTSEVVSPDSAVIIISNPTERYGIIVDIVDDIVQISEDKIVRTIVNKYISGVAKVNGTIINLLSSTGLISD